MESDKDMPEKRSRSPHKSGKKKGKSKPKQSVEENDNDD